MNEIFRSRPSLCLGFVEATPADSPCPCSIPARASTSLDLTLGTSRDRRRVSMAGWGGMDADHAVANWICGGGMIASRENRNRGGGIRTGRAVAVGKQRSEQNKLPPVSVSGVDRHIRTTPESKFEPAIGTPLVPSQTGTSPAPRTQTDRRTPSSYGAWTIEPSRVRPGTIPIPRACGWRGWAGGSEKRGGTKSGLDGLALARKSDEIRNK